MTVPVPLTADPTRLGHNGRCPATYLHGVCDCGLSALREAVAAGDPLAVLEAVGMGGTLVRTEWYWRVSTPPVGPPARDYLYRVVRPLPDAPEVSP